MGLTSDSMGINAVDGGLVIQKQHADDKVVALAGNPNVGKSTVFNQLTGLNQHTGNWPGKTVTNAQGTYTYRNTDYILVDIPGTYSLMAHSAEEEVARDFICFGCPDVSVVVCDATCLERNLNLVLQTIEITDNVVICVNLMDEAKRKNITVDFEALESLLGVPVIGCSARSNQGLDDLQRKVYDLAFQNIQTQPIQIKYTPEIEEAISMLTPIIDEKIVCNLRSRWIALRLLDDDETLTKSLDNFLGYSLSEDDLVKDGLRQANNVLQKHEFTKDLLKDAIVSHLVLTAQELSAKSVSSCPTYQDRDRKIDKILTNKWTGIPIMVLLLAVIFWLTITGANYPSQLLANGLFFIQDKLTEFFMWINAPHWLHGALVLGIYRVLAWVVSVMLPPMAIFFPLFTLLEDLGYLPRVAFNLDKYFKKACACGKQALTMCMGFGCNAAGIIGCRIIDSPRERLIAMITNTFVPCNGRFPALISIITMFFVGVVASPFQTVVSTLMLTGVIVFGILMTLLISKLLSKTILKGVPSSFILELPPYRRPQIGKVIVRSIYDRTLFVLGRAVIVAAPAGLVIWILANLTINDISLLSHCAGFLDPFAHMIGLDGVILLAFILGFPANEIVVPIIIMAYMSTGSLIEFDSLSQLKDLFVNNGWTWLTAICTMLFSLMHWPCSTTCLTIKKETQSLKWTAVAFAVPTVCGIGICFVITTLARLFHLV